MYAPFPSLDAYVAQIPEFRTRQGRRSDLGMVLRLICVAMLCGARSQVAIADWGQHLNQMWRQHLGFSCAMPSQPTIQRVLKGIAVLPLDQALHAWAEQILKHLP